MAPKPSSRLVRTPVFRMSYAKLDEPKPFMENGKPKGPPVYSVEQLFDPADLENFLVKRDGGWEECSYPRLLVELAKEEWGEDFNAAEATKHGGMKWPIQDGTQRAEDGKKRGKNWEAYRDKKAIRVKSAQDYPPKLFVTDAGKYRELDRDDDKDRAIIRKRFQSGHFAKANVTIKAVEVDGRKFLTHYVGAVLFWEEGEVIGGMDAEERFGGIEGGESFHDPTKGMDDEIPF